MIATLRDAKARLSHMVKLAGQGEDVLITVHGKIAARLTGASVARSARDNRKWIKELETGRAKYSTGRAGRTADEIVAEGRRDRV